jgi:hypothetical protein
VERSLHKTAVDRLFVRALYLAGLSTADVATEFIWGTEENHEISCQSVGLRTKIGTRNIAIDKWTLDYIVFENTCLYGNLSFGYADILFSE